MCIYICQGLLKCKFLYAYISLWWFAHIMRGHIYISPQGLNRVLKVLKGTETVKQDDDSAME